MWKDTTKKCDCNSEWCSCGADCNCTPWNCCNNSTDHKKISSCGCIWWCHWACNKNTSKISKIVWLIVLAWLAWLLRSWIGGWDTTPDIDVDQWSDSDQEQVIDSQRIWLVADDKEVDEVPTEPERIEPVDTGDALDETEIDDDDLEEIVKLLEEVLE